MLPEKLVPKLITVMREGLTRAQILGDISAGVIVGIVALPLAIAFAIASGVSPESGLYTAIIAGFIISALSGSRVQIGGPTGAFVVIVYSIVQKYGFDGMIVATIIAGVILVLMGIARFGAIIRFIPYPVTLGFTAGIALIIAMSQVRDLLGLQMDEVPADFIEKITHYSHSIHSFNLWAIIISAVTVLFIVFWPKVTSKVPGSMLALVVTTAAVQIFDLPVETINDRFGSVPSSLPEFQLPSVTFEQFKTLLSPALSIALLAGIESLLSAMVADGMTGRRHRSNMELIAQGTANIATPFFGGIPATGAIARTATNIKNGGRTPIAGITHAFTLLLILLAAGKWAGLIPMATLAGILMVVAYNMSEWRLCWDLRRGSRSDLVVLITTFLLTVVIDLTVAIQAGVVLAAILFMKRMSDTTKVGEITSNLEDTEESDDPYAIRTRKVPDGVQVFEINGPFFFGVADKFKHTLSAIHRKPKVLILRLRHVSSIDTTGLRALRDLATQTKHDGTQLILSGVQSQPLELMKRVGFYEEIGAENFQPDIDRALARANELLKTNAA